MEKRYYNRNGDVVAGVNASRRAPHGWHAALFIAQTLTVKRTEQVNQQLMEPHAGQRSGQDWHLGVGLKPNIFLI